MIRRTLILFAMMSAVVAAGDWRQFRGAGNSSVATDAKLPTDLSASKNIAWKVPVKSHGVSGPIVVNDRVIVTGDGGFRQSRLFVTCYDAKTGKQLWNRSFWATGRTLSHPTSANAAPTPASDGKRIFAFYSSNDLACLDLDGNLLWYRGLAHDYPKAGNDVGMSASPVVTDGVVIVQVENQGDSFATGVDAVSGEELWRVKRDPLANWASPAVVQGKDRNVVLLQSPSGLSAHDPRSGKQLWKYEASCSNIPSPVYGDGKIYFSSSAGITALKFKPSDTAPELAWESGSVRCNSASPIYYKGKLFALNRSVLGSANASDGKSQSKIRLAKGSYWATPVISRDRMYFLNDQGVAQIVDISGEKPKVISKTDLKERVMGSPAVAGNAMFIRSDSHLWKIAGE